MFLIWIVATLGAGLAGLLSISLLMKWIRSAALRRINAAVPNPESIVLLDTGANFYGLQSLGGLQLRGNGGLVLTSDHLLFLMLIPQRDFRIPISAVIRTSLVTSHCGKTSFRTLLQVSWHSETTTGGQPETGAWLVQDPEQWQRQIEKLRHA
jgi:hypothetical protein